MNGHNKIRFTDDQGRTFELEGFITSVESRQEFNDHIGIGSDIRSSSTEVIIKLNTSECGALMNWWSNKSKQKQFKNKLGRKVSKE